MNFKRKIVHNMVDLSDDVEGSATENTTGAADSLPMFDDSRGTARLCMTGLVFNWLAIVGCLVAAILLIKLPGPYLLRLIQLPATASEALSFTINIVVALATDCLGFIHGTSLRWALYREGRLHYNTNTRLLTSARTSAPNRWHSNLFCISSLILCYAGTSQLFIKAGVSDTFAVLIDGQSVDLDVKGYVWVNRIAVAALGLGLMGQAAVASWCMLSTLKETPTWSSNPLNNALAWLCVADVRYEKGRCMMSVHQQGLPAQKTRPEKRQRNLFAIRQAIQYIILLVWSLAILAIAWALAIVLVSRHTSEINHQSWYMTPSWYLVDPDGAGNYINVVPAFMNNQNSFPDVELWPQLLFSIMFTCAIQGAQTVGLHCVELLVNLSRDEKVWRAAYPLPRPSEAASKTKGAQLSSSGFMAAASSWENALLFILKALLHWLLGQCLQCTFEERIISFYMMYMRIFVFSVVAIVLAVFATYLALQTPSGPQPAAWGHLQTLVNLIDHWGKDAKGILWWGDKGKNGDYGTRHAGTSADLDTLEDIQMNAEYEGI